MDITSTPADENRWRAHAACRHDGPGYHEPQQPHPHCDTCPAAEPCLWFALAAEATVGYRYGYWGGTIPARRSRIAADLPPGDIPNRHSDGRGVAETTYSRRGTAWSIPLRPRREAAGPTTGAVLLQGIAKGHVR